MKKLDIIKKVSLHFIQPTTKVIPFSNASLTIKKTNPFLPKPQNVVTDAATLKYHR